MLIDEMEITQHGEGANTIFRLGFSIEIRQAVLNELMERARFDVEDTIKRDMRHKVKEELFKVFLENATAELYDRYMYAVDKRLGSSILENPAVEKGHPITLIHPVDFVRLLQDGLRLGDFFEWRTGSRMKFNKVIEAIDLFIALEHDKSQMIKDVFPRARAIQPEWRGGSFYDALKILEETPSYDLAMKSQDALLQTVIGIERYYDVEGHDNTVDVLKLTKRILLYHSSHMLGKEDVVKSSQLGFKIDEEPEEKNSK